MSTAKRTRQRPADAGPATALPPAKRAKVDKDSRNNASALSFLTDERQRSGRVIEAKPTNGVDSGRLDRADDTGAVIVNAAVLNSVNDLEGEDIQDAHASAEDDESSSDDTGSEHDMAEEPSHPTSNGTVTGTVALSSKGDQDASSTKLANGTNETTVDDDEQTSTEQTFGDLLVAAHPDVVDVAASFNDDLTSKPLAAPTSKALQAPSGNSLGTVLTQALRTNDRDLLESCLQTRDLASIKSTIQRLQSPLVATLLQKLAERLHKRPGRAGPLMLWVQWSLVTHGSYLAGQPDLVKKLRSLRQVVRERASSLQSLITLKGKLDMLGAQVELRRSMRAQRAVQDESDDSDEDIVYVEGEDNGFSSSSDDEDVGAVKQTGRNQPHALQKPRSGDIEEAGDVDMDGDIPLINGIDDDAEMDSVDEREDDDQDAHINGGLIDDEADESEGEGSLSSEEDRSGSESDEEEEDNDMSDISDDDDDVAAAPQTRLSRPLKRSSLIRNR